MKRVIITSICCIIMIACEVLNIHTIIGGMDKENTGQIVGGCVAFGICLAALISNGISLIYEIKNVKQSRKDNE